MYIENIINVIVVEFSEKDLAMCSLSHLAAAGNNFAELKQNQSIWLGLCEDTKTKTDLFLFNSMVLHLPVARCLWLT